MPHLACSFVRQLRCVFRCIAMAMQQKTRLADVQNSSAILQHLIRDTTLENPHRPVDDGGFPPPEPVNKQMND